MTDEVVKGEQVMDMPSLTRQQEAAWIRRLFSAESDDRGADAAVMALLERQFSVLHQRAQMLLALCGAVVTVTGFSGRAIAGTSRLAQWLVVGGLGMILLAGATVVAGVLSLRWLTQHPGAGTDQWLLVALKYRDRKTRCYRVSIVLLIVGLALYVVALSLMLLA